MNLTTRTVQGIGWIGVSTAIRLSIQFVILAILARLLTPYDFGLLAMVVVFTNFLAVFQDLGLTSAIVQRKEITEEHLSSSFWMNIFLGFSLALILSFSAPLFAHFYKEDKLTLITIILATNFVISSFGAVPTAIFTKELQFKQLAIVEIFSIVISGSIAVVLAFVKFGVWTLVLQSIISSFVRVLFLWKLSQWRPKFIFRWKRIKDLLGYGLNLMGFNFVNYFNRNLDNLLIGKFLGSIPLGYYNLAYRLLLFPLGNISQVVGRAMFPSLSIIQEDKNKVAAAYIKFTRYIATLTFPLMIGLFIVAPQFINVVYGPQWERVVLLVRIFALVGIGQSIGATVGWIYQSCGRTDILFKWGILSVVVITGALILGLRWDIEGVSIAYAIASYLLMYPSFAIPFRLINLKFDYFIRNFYYIFLAALGMGLTISGAKFFLVNIMLTNDVITLCLTVFIGIGSYAGFLFFLEKNLYREILELFKLLKPINPFFATKKRSNLIK